MEFFQHAILGGTFDHLHAGHKFFIQEAAANSSRLTIGLVQTLFEKKLFPHIIESFKTRELNLNGWVKEKRFSGVKVVPINDVFGTSLTDKSIDAIFVTRHGLPNAKLINEKRREKGLPELSINLVPFLKGSDGKVISSTRIRAGEIDREGRVYMDLFKKTINLPKDLRYEVKNIPSGILIRTDNSKTEGKFVITVGDVVSSRFKDADIKILDYKIKREVQKGGNINYDFKAPNNAGTINKEAVAVIKKTINAKLKTGKSKVIKIVGEEDLLSLPATLLAPLGSQVFYGMPDRGAIKVDVTEEKKEEVARLLEKLQKFTYR